MIIRNKKGQFVKGSPNPHKGDSTWINSGTFKTGHKHSEEVIKKISLNNHGNPKTLIEYMIKNGPWNKGKKLGPMSIEQRNKISKANSGNKSHLWKGGIHPKNLLERQRIEYRLWRESVFSRDNWTCQDCGSVGSKLNAHHIKFFSKYPELRFALDNGITLCKKCHILRHKLLKNKNI